MCEPETFMLHTCAVQYLLQGGIQKNVTFRTLNASSSLISKALFTKKLIIGLVLLGW